MRTVCDRCSQAFKVKYEELTHPKGVIETYFKCKECGHKYVCFVTDKKVRRLQKEMRRVRNKARKSEEDIEFLEEKLEEVKRIMTELKEDIG